MRRSRLASDTKLGCRRIAGDLRAGPSPPSHISPATFKLGLRRKQGVGLEVLHLAVQPREDLRRISGFQCVGAKGTPHPSHDDGSVQAGASHAPDYQAKLARGQGEHVIPLAADTALARDEPAPISAPATAGGADGIRLRCKATAATRSARVVIECTAVAARSAAICSSSPDR